MEKVKISVSVDEEIHKRLKYKTFDEGITVQQIVEAALKHYLKPEDESGTNIEASKRTVQQTVKRMLSDGDAVVLENVAVALRAIERMTHKDKDENKAA